MAEKADWSKVDEDDDLDLDFNPDNISEPGEDDYINETGRAKPEREKGFSRFVVVRGTPKVTEEKVPKLKKALTSIFSDFGDLLDIYLGESESSTTGFCLLEYKDAKQAAKAIEGIDGYRMDKNHTLTSVSMEDFEKFENIDLTYVVPKKPEYIELPNFKQWLVDEKARSQYLCQTKKETSVFWHHPTQKEGLHCQSNRSWLDRFASWSSLGLYLASSHGRGVRIWAGEKFDSIMRFEHENVQLFAFSPCDRYLVTFSEEQQEQIIVWDVRSGKKRRVFARSQQKLSPWPIFKWSFDGSYFARMMPDSLEIYETSTFKHVVNNSVGKRSPFEIPNIQNFEWSPSANVISYWTPEGANEPARVVLFQVPTQTELRRKNLFNVVSCSLHWQSQGKFLAVKIDRGGKKAGQTDYEIYWCGQKEKDIPVELCEGKDHVNALAWEPKGHKFISIHGSNPSSQTISFFDATPTGVPKIEKIKSVEKEQVTHIFWSPQGRFVVLALLGKGLANGFLQFWDTTTMELLGNGEHYMATDVEWDPTGRYVATIVSSWKHDVDCGFYIWSFKGQVQHRFVQDGFAMFNWRPTPPSLLTDDEIANAQKNLKKVWQSQFEEEDKKESEAHLNVEKKKRDQTRADFLKLWEQRMRDYAKDKPQRTKIRGYDSDDESQWEEREVVQRIELSREVTLI